LQQSVRRSRRKFRDHHLPAQRSRRQRGKDWLAEMRLEQVEGGKHTGKTLNRIHHARYRQDWAMEKGKESEIVVRNAAMCFVALVFLYNLLGHVSLSL
jgi:hypothetical protein